MYNQFFVLHAMLRKSQVLLVAFSHKLKYIKITEKAVLDIIMLVTFSHTKINHAANTPTLFPKKSLFLLEQ